VICRTLLITSSASYGSDKLTILWPSIENRKTEKQENRQMHDTAYLILSCAECECVVIARICMPGLVTKVQIQIK